MAEGDAMDSSTYSMVLETSEKLFAGRGGEGFDPAVPLT